MFSLFCSLWLWGKQWQNCYKGCNRWFNETPQNIRTYIIVSLTPHLLTHYSSMITHSNVFGCQPLQARYELELRAVDTRFHTKKIRRNCLLFKLSGVSSKIREQEDKYQMHTMHEQCREIYYLFPRHLFLKFLKLLYPSNLTQFHKQRRKHIAPFL